MIFYMNNIEIVKKMTQHAENFFKKHKTKQGVSQTFGYFTHHPVAPLNQKRLFLLLETLQEISKKQSGSLRILDLCCGGGLIACTLASSGHRVLGLDINPEEIALARLFAQEELLNGFFDQTDLLQNPDWELKAENALGGKPHIVVLCYALHHIFEVERLLARLSKWLPAGSVLLINEENPSSPLFRLKHWVRGYLQNDTDVEWHRTHEGWKSLLISAGFQVSQIENAADFLPFFPPEKQWSILFHAEKI